MDQDLYRTLNTKRRHSTILSKFEGPVINFLVKSYPRWITPDMLTYIGLIVALLIFLTFYLVNFNPLFIWLANFLIVIHWIADSTNGQLDFYRKTPRVRYGDYIDHIFDMIYAITLFLGLGISPILSFNLAIILLIIFYLYTLHSALLAIHDGFMRISYSKIGPTEGQVVAIFVGTFWFFFPALANRVVDLLAWIVIVVSTLFLIIQIYKTIVKLKKMDEMKLKK